MLRHFGSKSGLWNRNYGHLKYETGRMEVSLLFRRLKFALMAQVWCFSDSGQSNKAEPPKHV